MQGLHINNIFQHICQYGMFLTINVDPFLMNHRCNQDFSGSRWTSARGERACQPEGGVVKGAWDLNRVFCVCLQNGEDFLQKIEVMA